MSIQVVRETTGTVRLCIEATQHDFAELCESLERPRKTNADKKAIEDLVRQVRIAAGLDDDPGTLNDQDT